MAFLAALVVVALALTLILLGARTRRAWRPLVLWYRTGMAEPTIATRECPGFLGSTRMEDRGRGLLILAATPDGLYLALRSPFRFLSPPVLVPWRDVDASAGREPRVVTMTFDRCRELPLRVPGDIAIRLLSSVKEMHLKALSLQEILGAAA